MKGVDPERLNREDSALRELILKGFQTGSSPVDWLLDDLIDATSELANLIQQVHYPEPKAEFFEPVLERVKPPLKQGKTYAITDDYYQLPKFRRYKRHLKGRFQPWYAGVFRDLSHLLVKLRAGRNLTHDDFASLWVKYSRITQTMPQRQALEGLPSLSRRPAQLSESEKDERRRAYRRRQREKLDPLSIHKNIPLRILRRWDRRIRRSSDRNSKKRK